MYCNVLKDYELNAWLILRLKSKPSNFALKTLNQVLKRPTEFRVGLKFVKKITKFPSKYLVVA